MTVKDIDELAAEKYLSSGDVDTRIEELERLSRDDPDAWAEAEGSDDELLELTEFRDDIAGQVGVARWKNGLTLIADSAWEEYADSEAQDIYGREVVESGFFRAEKFADEMKTDYQNAELSGYEFWYR